MSFGENVVKLAKRLGRKEQQVVEDLKVCKKIQSNPVWAVNEFFVKGKGWLYDPLAPYQAAGVERFFSKTPKVLEIWPRGHCKTTLFSRACCLIESATGQSPYTVIFSSTESNTKGTKQAYENMLKAPLFKDLQWYLAYFNGSTDLASITAEEIVFASGAVIEFKSFFGEARGANRSGRPTRIHLDDVLVTEVGRSMAMREEATDRYYSMIKPMGEQGAKTSIVGTVHHRDDFLWKLATGKVEGYLSTVLPACTEKFENILWPERWTKEDLQKEYREYSQTGRAYLFRREYLCDPAVADTHPLQNYELDEIEFLHIDETFRIVAVDHAHGTGNDKFVITEAGFNRDHELEIFDIRTSRDWTMDRRLLEVGMVLRRRRPNVLAIQRTSESIGFIEQLEKYLKQEGLMMSIQQPTWNRGEGKNDFIYGYLQPMFAEHRIKAKKGAPFIQEVHDEMHSFDMTSKSNGDDVLETIATCVKYAQSPKDNVKVNPSGNPLIDQIRKDMLLGDRPEHSRKYNRTRIGWR